MQILLVTTLPGLEENERLGQEAEKLGHNLRILDLSTFGFLIKSNQPRLIGGELEADAVIVRGIFNSTKAISTITGSLREKGIKVFDNNFAEHKYSIDKVTDILKLSLASLPVPDTAYSRDFDKYSDLAKKIGYPIVVKSVRSGKGAQVFKVQEEKKLIKLINDLQKEGREAKSYLLQKFIPYKYDLRTLIVGENVFTMRRIPAEREFRANFSLGASVELFNLDKEGRNLALGALSAVDMSVGGVDILITEDNERFLLEVNHTAGFVGMEKATGKNIAKLYLEHALKEAR